MVIPMIKAPPINPPTFDECGTAGKDGVYVLQNDINATDDCIYITSDNVWIDLNGYTNRI